MTTQRKEIIIRAQVTEAQALAIEAMIKQWNELGSIGSSRFVAFYADGDGNFRPRATIEKPPEFRELTDSMVDMSTEWKDNICYIDFDPIAWHLTELNNGEPQ